MVWLRRWGLDLDCGLVTTTVRWLGLEDPKDCESMPSSPANKWTLRRCSLDSPRNSRTCCSSKPCNSCRMPSVNSSDERSPTNFSKVTECSRDRVHVCFHTFHGPLGRFVFKKTLHLLRHAKWRHSQWNRRCWPPGMSKYGTATAVKPFWLHTDTELVTAGHKAPEESVLENSAATDASPKLLALKAVLAPRIAESAWACPYDSKPQHTLTVPGPHKSELPNSPRLSEKKALTMQLDATAQPRVAPHQQRFFSASRKPTVQTLRLAWNKNPPAPVGAKGVSNRSVLVGGEV